jgi:antitoxin CptB
MSAHSEEKLAILRRKLLFRSWHRGTREMDLILGRFAVAWLERLTPSELEEYERLIEAPDGDLHDWIAGDLQPPSEWACGVLDRLRQFYERPRS